MKSTKRYHINLKHGGLATRKDSFAWIDIQFKEYQSQASQELRQGFEKTLQALRKIYLEDLEKFYKAATKGINGGLETSAIRRGSLA